MVRAAALVLGLLAITVAVTGSIWILYILTLYSPPDSGDFGRWIAIPPLFWFGIPAIILGLVSRALWRASRRETRSVGGLAARDS